MNKKSQFIMSTGKAIRVGSTKQVDADTVDLTEDPAFLLSLYAARVCGDVVHERKRQQLTGGKFTIRVEWNADPGVPVK